MSWFSSFSQALTQSNGFRVTRIKSASASLVYLGLVDLLTPIGHLVAYDSTNVLYDHGVLLQILSCVQTQALDAGSCQINIVLPLSLQAPILGRLGVDKLLAVWCVQLSSEGALVGL